jgi:predicted nucleic acid-binding protein
LEDFLSGRLFGVSNHKALEIAFEYHVTAYDARFLAVAIVKGTRLVTEDRKLRAAAPKLTQSLDEAIIAAR